MVVRIGKMEAHPIEAATVTIRAKEATAAEWLHIS